MVNEELLSILLSWAALLSPYDKAPVPDLVYRPHEFFVEQACGGVECNVVAWYNDTGVIFLDPELDPQRRDDIIVHELVHYLQDKSKLFNSFSCYDSVAREKEAYAVQLEYMNATGMIIRPSVIKMRCNKGE